MVNHDRKKRYAIVTKTDRMNLSDWEKSMETPKPATAEKRMILEAAKELFVAQGFTATSMDEIAAQAEVTAEVVRRHFDNKEQLWQEVKSDSLLAEDFEFSLIENCKDLDSFLEFIVKKRFSLYEKRPDIVQMIAWQNVEAVNKIEQADELLGKHPLSPTSWGEYIRVLQYYDKVRDDIDPEFIAHYIANASTAIFYAPSRLSDDPEKRASYLDFVINSLKTTLQK